MTKTKLSRQVHPSASGRVPKVNWPEHASAHIDFSCQDKFLSSNFLFSLPEHKSAAEGTSSARYTTYS
ncbi:hypothetical protein FRX31_024014 [Thalictrum thalictroides]|uniref:Uncharacterized protein n=1 Tax=Thalictrum thalictroides TaxID=46969 RepID=A0A7J6VMS1_THATH|nr:hypothetical protein FRX31_024014 [Thalictrum thalictroides]